ncbi:MAG TPA: helix-turn-helix transcriptional regulator [Candidatus Dormibacteraeota bacterium]|nr:helix-turn-helix transcriptional regulator [Candidatus Dormibacteraeota bacterium]
MSRPQRSLYPHTQRQAEELGARLKAARRRRRMSEAEMAARALVSRPTLRRLERGDLSVSAATLVRVLEVLSHADDLNGIVEHDDLGQQIADARLPLPHRPRTRGLADDL